MDNVVVRGESKSPSALLDKYQRHTGAFDEFLADGGVPRPQYNKIFTELEEFSVSGNAASP